MGIMGRGIRALDRRAAALYGYGEKCMHLCMVWYSWNHSVTRDASVNT